MQRWARARFLVFRINRWSLALIIFAVLALLLIPPDGSLPTLTGDDTRVKQGVTVYGRDFSGLNRREALARLREMATTMVVPAMGARLERKDDISYVIPELNGYTLDLDATWARLAAAPEGSEVQPVARVHTPTKRLSDYPESVIRQGNANKPAVSLLINVDWGTKELTEMLPVLKRRGVKVTFFVSGRWADQNERLLRLMAMDGHEIATHGQDLRFGPADLARAGKLKSDIQQSVETIERITQTKVTYYSPHKAEVNPSIVKTASELNLRTVLYSLDTVDWQPSASSDQIVATVQNAMPGDLILMHPKPNTAKALDQIITSLKTQGLQPVTLSVLLSPDPGLPSDSGTTREHPQ